MLNIKSKNNFSKPQLLIFLIAFSLIGYLIFKSFAAPNPNLPGDLNGDNTVNVTDMSILLSNYGTSNANADINGDGTVNVLDMSILLSHYGQSYTPTQTLTQSSSLTNNATISGTYPWKVTTNITESQVEFFVENVSLGKISGTTSFTYNLDTTKYPDGAHNGGYWIYDSAGAAVYKSPSINFTVQNGTPGSTGSGSILSFQSFPGGVDDSDVKSWPISGHVAAHATGGPNNGPYGRYTADATTTNGDGDIRVHDWDSGSKFPMLQPGSVSWRHIAIRIPSGFTNTDQSLFAGDEVHQSSQYGTTGPAPVNLSEDGIGNNWYFVARGNNARGLTGESFHQTVFGRASNNNGTLVPFQGGARKVVADRWTYWLVGEKWDYLGAGWVEIWYRDSTTGAWINVVPRYSNIYTSYNNQNFPMSSLYAPVSSGGGTRGIDFANGFYSDDYSTALAKANQLDGF